VGLAPGTWQAATPGVPTNQPTNHMVPTRSTHQHTMQDGWMDG